MIKPYVIILTTLVLINIPCFHQVPAPPLAGPVVPEEAVPAAAGAPGGRPARGVPQRAHARPRRRPLPRPIRHAQGAHRAGKASKLIDDV